jgi:chromosomal replication initiator protein
MVVNAYALPGLKGEYKFINAKREYKSEYIVMRTTGYYGETLENVLKKGREREMVTIRHVICFLLRRYTSLSLKEVGNIFDQDHTTIMNAVRNISNLIQTDDNVKKDVQNIEMLLL